MKNPGIYILTHKGTGEQYVGKDSRLPSRAKEHLSGKNPQCRRVHRAIQKYGRDAFSVEIIPYPHISQEALNAVERWKIRQLQTLAPSGYNLTEGGEGGNPSEETRQKISEIASKRVEDGTHNFLGGEVSRRTNRKRVEDGTHNLLGENNPNHKRLEDGTHNFLDSEFQRRTQKKRLDEGTHHLLSGEIQRRSAQKRVKDGTHNLLSENNPVHKQLADGTHNFLDSEFQRRYLLGENNPVHKRLENGTHHFLGESNPAKRRTFKRLKAEWCYIIALSRFWYEIHDYTLKRRAEFLSKDIPDMSNAEQTYLF